MTPAIDLQTLPDILHRDAFRVAGLSGRFDGDTRGAIPGLWGKLIPLLPAPSQRGWRTYGLCWSGDLDQGFDYMAGVEVESDAAAAMGMEVKEVPAQAYVVFRLTISGGDLHPQMTAAMAEIWGERLQAAGLTPSGGPDFELYPEDFDGRRPGAYVDFCIPVKAEF